MSDFCDPTRLLCPWDFPIKNTGVACHFLLQGIFQTQESNPGLLHCWQILYLLSYEGSPIQRWHTPFSIWNQSIVPWLHLTVASWPAYRLLWRQIRWSSIPISLRIFQFVVIHTVKGFSIVSDAEANVFFWNFLAFSMIQWVMAI